MAADPLLTILACQIDIPAMRTEADRDRHLHKVRELIAEQLERRPADLVVLPELSSLDYSAAAFSRLALLAESDQGSSHQVFAELADHYDCNVVFGYARKHSSQPQDSGDRRGGTASPRYTIAQQMLAPLTGGKAEAESQFNQATRRRITVYEKIALAQFGDSSEKDYFQHGSKLQSFQLGGIVVGLLICYDIRFPELCRRLQAEHGCSLILHCGAYARDASFATREAFVTTRAMENQIPILALNRAGQHYGESLWVPPWVDDDRPLLRLHASDQQFQYFSWPASAIAAARQQFPILSDWQAIRRNLDHGAAR